ncbi:MAG: UDP-4-amino-4,6-dideoxy-N-acetyl-beta-L-altrosamine N-acetyltransferase [Methylibium sp.]|nr:UDP-4-amino-4,6-dideoxy-N-acetyl-beta-L-altrosamine N-acetyltransferase [Methylibium sp.]
MVNQDLSAVLVWRNHPDVGSFMFNQAEITPQEHQQWFKRTSMEEGRHLLIFECDGRPRGFVNVHMRAADRIADWGFYVAPDAVRGTGRRLGDTALNYTFSFLEAHKLCARALAYNRKSIKFHLALGFQQEGVLRDQHFDGHGYHDVACFGLLSGEWHRSK